MPPAEATAGPERGGGADPGARRFMGLDIALAADVLAPRAETELLGRVALGILRDRPGPQQVVDMGCGSGNLACAVAAALPAATLWACDLTEPCAALARRNAARLGLSGRVHVRRGDLFEALRGADLDGRVDLVICNPPYISTARLAGESAHLLRGEPREAFDGGPYGLTLHQRVIGEALGALRPGGWLALDFGAGQDQQIAALFRRASGYGDLDYARDDGGLPRVAVARKAG